MNKAALNRDYDVIVLGAGAAGLMCAAEAGRHGKSVLVLDHAEKAGKKVLISGGGRCNFTNLYCEANHFVSQNPHFCKSALSRFNQYDTIAMFEGAGIAWHEREHGQLFCDESAKQVVDMLLKRCEASKVSILLECAIQSVEKLKQFQLETSKGVFSCASLIVATGGLSIPKMGATGLGYQIARHFGMDIVETKAGLVPFRLTGEVYESLKGLAGISLPVCIQCGGQSFSEAMLFTHRGLSGPAILQISSYWKQGDAIEINMLPTMDIQVWLMQLREQGRKQALKTVLAEILPKRLVAYWCEHYIEDKPLPSLSKSDLKHISQQLHAWRFKPAGTEGYRTAEVTVGGVGTHELSSKTMESKKVSGLYFIGEVVDVTGHLGGFNFQWAWASAYAAGVAASKE